MQEKKETEKQEPVKQETQITKPIITSPKPPKPVKQEPEKQEPEKENLDWELERERYIKEQLANQEETKPLDYSSVPVNPPRRKRGKIIS
jgi:hypothetical protein